MTKLYNYLIHLLGGMALSEFEASRDSLVNLHRVEREYLYGIIERKLDVLIEDRFTPQSIPSPAIDEKALPQFIPGPVRNWGKLKMQLEVEDRKRARLKRLGESNEETKSA